MNMAILAETTAQVLVDDTITLPLPAEKIDEIVASVRDLKCFVIENKVVFQGILHKQIFFVDLTGFVRHFGIDIPFSGFADLPGVPANSSCVVSATIRLIEFQLIAPDKLREIVIIDVNIQVNDTIVSGATGTNVPIVNCVRFAEPGTVRASGGRIKV
jgi:hypothetical protein